MSTEPLIVLIDDDRAWLDTLSEFLRDRGYEVRTADRAGSGLKLLQESPAHLAFIDCNMPDMNGLDLLRLIRRQAHQVHVVMVSGESDPTLPSRAKAEGARDFLSKSAAPDLLLRSIRYLVTSMINELMRNRYLPVLRRRREYLPIPVSRKGA